MFNRKLKEENAALKKEVAELNRQLKNATDSRIHLRKIIKSKDRVIYSLKHRK